MAYSDGDDFISGAILSYQQANRIKNNWRAAAAVSNPSAGMLRSDSDDDYLYHRGAAAWNLVYQYQLLVEYDDIRISGLAVQKQGSNDPTLTQWLDDAGGTSPGIYLYYFADEAVEGNEEEVFFAIQLPHSYVEGSDILAHVHWIPAANGGAGEFVKWGLEYVWLNEGDVGGDTTVIHTDASDAGHATRSGDAALVANTHYVSVFSAAISGVGMEISSMLICRLFRNSSDADDDYTDAAGLLEFDFHIQKESVGSVAAWSK